MFMFLFAVKTDVLLRFKHNYFDKLKNSLYR